MILCFYIFVFLKNKKSFYKIIPSFFTIKEGSTFLTKPLFPQGREDVTALRCSEPLRFKVGGPSKVCAMLCGMGPLGVGGRNNTVAHFSAGLSLSRGERLLAYGGFPQISQIAQIWIPIQSLKVVTQISQMTQISQS